MGKGKGSDKAQEDIAKLKSMWADMKIESGQRFSVLKDDQKRVHAGLASTLIENKTLGLCAIWLAHAPGYNCDELVALSKHSATRQQLTLIDNWAHAVFASVGQRQMRAVAFPSSASLVRQSQIDRFGFGQSIELPQEQQAAQEILPVFLDSAGQQKRGGGAIYFAQSADGSRACAIALYRNIKNGECYIFDPTAGVFIFTDTRHVTPYVIGSFITSLLRVWYLIEHANFHIQHFQKILTTDELSAARPILAVSPDQKKKVGFEGHSRRGRPHARSAPAYPPARPAPRYSPAMLVSPPVPASSGKHQSRKHASSGDAVRIPVSVV